MIVLACCAFLVAVAIVVIYAVYRYETWSPKEPVLKKTELTPVEERVEEHLRAIGISTTTYMSPEAVWTQERDALIEAKEAARVKYEEACAIANASPELDGKAFANALRKARWEYEQTLARLTRAERKLNRQLSKLQTTPFQPVQ